MCSTYQGFISRDGTKPESKIDDQKFASGAGDKNLISATHKLIEL